MPPIAKVIIPKEVSERDDHALCRVKLSDLFPRFMKHSEAVIEFAVVGCESPNYPPEIDPSVGIWYLPSDETDTEQHLINMTGGDPDKTSTLLFVAAISEAENQEISISAAAIEAAHECIPRLKAWRNRSAMTFTVALRPVDETKKRGAN